MGIHVGSFTLGGIVGAGVMGYLVMKSPIGGEVKDRALVAAKKKAEEEFRFLLWGDKRGLRYKDEIPRDKEGRPDYTAVSLKDKKVDEVYFKSERDASIVFSAIHDEIETCGHCSVANFISIAAGSMTGYSTSKVQLEFTDYKYGWDMHDLGYFDDKFFQTMFISGKGWQFWVPFVRKI